ncbi:thiamine pyrophosphate-binding protein [Micromonospora sp. NPDC048830]|uniref:thiamine pyrophosphate-binding protein n=1 Tax=Micromonospora sp. NPDC048830 TaxID=3364257 RepID=UPI003720F570
MTKVYEHTIGRLVDSGVTTFAGMVGSTTAPYVARLGATPGARYIGVRHEQTAAALVDAAARLTGRAGCLLTHGASGALAASLGVAAAARDFTPMVWISATQERRALEQRWWQTLNVLGPARDYVKWQARVERPDRAPQAVDDAILAAVSGRPGVAQLDLPIDVSTAELAPSELPVRPALDAVTGSVPQPPASAEDVQAAAAALGGARRPVLVVGAGVRYAGGQRAAERLAEAAGLAVVCTANARGDVSETHEYSLGPSGIIGFEPASMALRDADLVLAVGCRLSDMLTARGEFLGRDVKVLHVDLCHDSIPTGVTDYRAIVADAGEFLEQVTQAVLRGRAAIRPERVQWVRDAARKVAEWRDAWLLVRSENGRVQPNEVVHAMRQQLRPDAVITHGAGDHGFYGTLLPVSRPGAHLMSVKLGAMGCGLGMAMGARLVAPRRQVLACLGDGELMLQIGDLETMVREQLPTVVVVFNNFRLGSQRRRVQAYGPAHGTDHGNPDFAALAQLFGAWGGRVDEPGQFADALKEALAADRPAVIDVIVDPEARPRRIAVSREAT